MLFGFASSRVWRILLLLLIPAFFVILIWNGPRTRIFSAPHTIQHHDPVQDVTSLPRDDFQHTAFFRPRQRPFDGCSLIGADEIKAAARRVEDAPVAFHYQHGKIYEGATQDVGAAFCIVFCIPQKPWESTTSYRPREIVGMGPDAIVAEMASADVKYVFTEHPLYHETFPSERWDVAVYSAPYILNHPGQYQLSAIAELQNYQWTQEDPIRSVFRVPEEIANAVDLSFRYGNVTIESKPPTIIIAGIPLSRPTRPCFGGDPRDLRGRWYRADAFNSHGNQTLLNPRAQLEFASQPAVTDELGWTFAPDGCALGFLTADDHLSCFANRSLQFFGDSNLRRLAKSFVSGGDKWCMIGAYDTTCQCKDGDQDEGLLDAASRPLNATLLRNPFSQRDAPVFWGHNSRLFFDFVGGLQNPHWGNTWPLYFNGSYVDPVIVGDSGFNLVQQRQIQYGDMDVVLLSLVVWDVAAIVTPAETLSALSEFRSALFASYSGATRFVLRLSNSVCCGTGGPKQRFSSPRFEMWNVLFREFWSQDILSGKMSLYDASILSGRQDMALAIPCGAPHLSACHVRIETQLLANMLCDKRSGGDARLRAA